MFTGIVECIGRVKSLQRRTEIVAIAVEVPIDISDSRIGDSFSISGACLTAIRVETNSVHFEISKETLERTTLGSLRVGSTVNVERALRLSDRLGGHLVTGHIDTTGEVVEVLSFSETTRLKIRTDSRIAPYLVEKGSMCIDGVSLTLGTCQDTVFFVHLIPHTLKMTTLHSIRVGDRVNLEVDLIGKYVERFLAQRGLLASQERRISEDFLEKFGFL
jgi:riboflavin synthase